MLDPRTTLRTLAILLALLLVTQAALGGSAGAGSPPVQKKEQKEKKGGEEKREKKHRGDEEEAQKRDDGAQQKGHPAESDDRKSGDERGGVWRGEPYTLSTCAASGRDINVKETPQTVWMHGRELKFCCKGCANAVLQNPDKFLGKVDEAMIARQAPLYPTKDCIVSGESLHDDEGKFTGVEFLAGNRLFRVCCKRCAAKVKSDPRTYAAKLDALVRAQYEAKDAYPIETCLVQEDEELGEDPVTLVIAGRPLKVCCKGCAKKVKKDPTPFVETVDAALAVARAKAAAKAEGGKGEARAGTGATDGGKD